MALITEMAGAITASPKKSEVPIRPMDRISRFSLGRSPTVLSTRESSAMMPPSPLLSARMINRAYLRPTTISSNQKTRERIPMTCSAVGDSALLPLKATRKA